MLYLRRICAAGLLLGVMILHPDRGNAALSSAAVRAQFTAAQWKQLSRVVYTALILPAYVPAGFKVRSVEVRRNNGGLGTESYSIVYSNGVRAIFWDGANWSAGGDAPPQSFQATYHSRVLGSGVVSMVHGGDFSATEAGGDCWSAEKPDYQQAGAINNFGLSVCDSKISPYDAARIMNSMVLISSGKPRPRAFDRAKQSFVVWSLVSSVNGYRMDAVDYVRDDPCVQRMTPTATPSQQSMMATVTGYYDDWNAGRLDSAWTVLSQRYQSAHHRSVWLNEHGKEKAIGVILACIAGSNRVGATLQYVDR